jgi:hypothetical protein
VIVIVIVTVILMITQYTTYEAIRATGDAVIIAESVEHEISLGFDS